MDLLELLRNTGAGDSVDEMASAVGLGSSDTGQLIGALAPALLGGLRRNTTDDDGIAGLQKALQTGSHQRYIDDPGLMRSDATRDDGNAILGHLFGSKDVSRKVAAQAAEKTGIDASLIKKALPLLAGLAMAAMSKKTSAGREIGRSSSQGGLGPLGDLLGGDDGFGLDDMIGMARKFF